MTRKHNLFLGAFLSALLLFTVYVLLDTFVIERRIEAAAETQPIGSRPADDAAETAGETGGISLLSSPQTEDGSAERVTTENCYQDGNVSVQITEERINGTTVYVADVQLTSAAYLQTAFADNTYGRNVTDTTSGIAESVNAVLAINGDFYGAKQSGYVIRNGVLYRSTAKKGAEDLVIYKDGSFAIIREAEVTAEELLEDGAQQVLSFGPALIENGEIIVSASEEVGRA